MDELKLHQFGKISNSYTALNNPAYEFLKTQVINVNSSISDKFCEENTYAGYTYLHFAAKNLDLPSIKELIQRNADLVKQGCKDGKTPLHIVTEALNNRISCDTWIVGKLKPNVFVDTLLSEQVKNLVSSNPQSKQGMSHLHIACVYNHIEAIKLLLNNKESVNQSTNADHRLPGYTALHFAVRYSSLEAAEILIEHGADMHQKDCKGESALHCLMLRLMHIADFLVIGKLTYYPFYKQERNIVESILEILLKRKQNGNTCVSDDTGLTALHVACTLKAPIIAKRLRQNRNLNVTTKNDSKLWPGWTPLHFAACFSIETFKLLFCLGADFKMKNARGETPLDICMQRYSPHIVYSILLLKEDFKNILFSDGSTKVLDIIFSMTNSHVFINQLKDLADVNTSIPLDSPIWPGCNLLHLAVLNERIRLKSTFPLEKMLFENDYEIDRIEDALLRCWKIIIHTLSKCCSLNKKNADGLTPVQLALNLHKKYSMTTFLDVCQTNFDDSASDLSIFHFACAVDNKSTVEWFIKEKKTNVNEPLACSFEWYSTEYDHMLSVRANSTSLHIAVIFDNEELVNYLLEEGADVYAKDSLGLTPIHLSVVCDEENYDGPSIDIAELLLTKTRDLKDCVSSGGFTHLHVAAYANNVVAIMGLLRNGANVNKRFQPIDAEIKSMFLLFVNETPFDAATLNDDIDDIIDSREAIDVLVKAGADVFGIPGKLISTAMSYGRQSPAFDHFIRKLKQKKRKVIGPLDETGVTMLHFACYTLDITWVKNLLMKGADSNARVKDDFEGQWKGFSPLHVLVQSFSDEHNELANLIELFELLIEYGADVTIENGQASTPLHELYQRACSGLKWFYSDEKEKPKPNYLSAIGSFIKRQKNYDVNPVDHCGLSHLHLACLTNNGEIVETFLNNGFDVNQSCELFIQVKRHAGWTALHFACEQNNLDVVSLLIERDAKITAEDLGGNTPLHIALKQGCFNLKLVKLLLRRGADVNAKNMEGITPVQSLMLCEGFTLGQFRFMLNQGASINLVDFELSKAGFIGLAMKNAKSNFRLRIFNEVVAACGMENLIKMNAIESAVGIENNGRLPFNFYRDVIQYLVGAGCDLNKQDENGKTALHKAVYFDNFEAVKALLLIGADFDIEDESGQSPLTMDIIKSFPHSMCRRNTVTLFVTQIWKKNHIDELNVSQYNRSALDKLFSKIMIDYDSVGASCLSELEKTVNMYCDDDYREIFFHDFLSETDAVMKYSRMPLALRKRIDCTFKGTNLARMQQTFPEWAGIITMQYRKAVARNKMIKPAMGIIFSAGIKLPVICLQKIVEHFSHDDLKLLVGKY